ncbi:MAG: flippase-like domain-containing protein [Deltaproteobacteria bacterium]|nr:flippase-like domain-containing protein [Deltaproteobacteria bacterium]
MKQEAAAARRYTPKKILIGVLGIVLSIGGLLYAFNGVEFSQLVETTSRIRVAPLILSIVAYWAGVVVARALLVKYLLRRMGDLPWIRAYRCLGIGFLANNVLPLRMGDLARSAAMAKAVGIPFSTVVGGVALERMLDMIMVAVVGFLAIQVAPLPEKLDVLRTFITWSGIILGVAFVLLIVIARSKMEKNILGQSRLGQFIWSYWLKFSAGFRALQDFKGVAIVMLLELFLWGCALAHFSWKLAAFDLPSGIDHSMVLLTCLGAAVALPSAPGYVGVYHAAARIAVSQMAGVEDSVAVAFALFSWVIDIICGNLVGMVSMIFEGMKFGDLKRVGDLSVEPAE